MNIEVMDLWDNVPGMCEEVPKITAYIPENKTADCAVVILPGGGYGIRAEHEGKGYAEFFNKNGICAFVVDYRVAPHRFPLPLLDSRRGVQFVRFYAQKYGINKNKVLIMGSSAGGHLSALTSTYFNEVKEFEINDEISKESFIPDAQILCYPVINLACKRDEAHYSSGIKLLGENYELLCHELTPSMIASKETPPAFIWHTFNDNGVSVKNSLDYAKALKEYDVDVEMHIYPHGPHGMGIPVPDSKVSEHVLQWPEQLLCWMKYMDF